MNKGFSYQVSRWNFPERKQKGNKSRTNSALWQGSSYLRDG